MSESYFGWFRRLSFAVSICAFFGNAATDCLAKEVGSFAGNDLTRISQLLAAKAVNQRTSRVFVSPDEFQKGRRLTLFSADGPGIITHIWITFPPGDLLLGRRSLLRFFWEGEESPSVEAPLGDFFGVPFGFTGVPEALMDLSEGSYFSNADSYSGPEFRLSSEYLVVAPNNGFNCYFLMPFREQARIELHPDQEVSRGGFYVQVDYFRFEERLPEAYRDIRFHAQYRFENPCDDYGDYLFLDATGKGALIGLTLAIEANDPQRDFWPHGGGDTLFIDGETDPVVLNGIGSEDFFGQSWGVKPFVASYIGTSFYQIKENHPRYDKDQFKRLSAFRFFVKDPVLFYSSLRAVMGTMANSYSSVVYWYQTEPHQPFFRTPSADLRLPDSVASYGTHDIEPASSDQWMLLARFPLDAEHPFERELAFESGESGEERAAYIGLGKSILPEANQAEAGNGMTWTPQRAYHNFVSFKPLFGRKSSAVVGYALHYMDSTQEKDVWMQVGFDDQIRVRLNDTWVFQGHNEDGFASETFRVQLRKGRNRILVKLSNQANTNFHLWAFSMRILD